MQNPMLFLTSGNAIQEHIQAGDFGNATRVRWARRTLVVGSARWVVRAPAWLRPHILRTRGNSNSWRVVETTCHPFLPHTHTSTAVRAYQRLITELHALCPDVRFQPPWVTLCSECAEAHRNSDLCLGGLFDYDTKMPLRGMAQTLRGHVCPPTWFLSGSAFCGAQAGQPLSVGFADPTRQPNQEEAGS